MTWAARGGSCRNSVNDCWISVWELGTSENMEERPFGKSLSASLAVFSWVFFPQILTVMDYMCHPTVSKVKISLQILCLYFLFPSWVSSATSLEMCWDTWLFHCLFLEDRLISDCILVSVLSLQTSGYHIVQTVSSTKKSLWLRITNQLLLHYLQQWLVLSKACR